MKINCQEKYRGTEIRLYVNQSLHPVKEKICHVFTVIFKTRFLKEMRLMTSEAVKQLQPNITEG